MTCFLRVVATVAAAVALLSGSTSVITAAEIAVTPNLAISANVDDNPTLVSRGREGAAGVSAQAGATFEVRSPTRGLVLKPTVTIERFTKIDRVDLDQDDFAISANGYQLGERFRAELNASFVRDTSRASELEDIGVVRTNKPRTTVRFSPSVSYALTERTAASFSTFATDVRFSDAERTSLVDYHQVGAQTGLSHAWNERDKSSLAVFASRYDASDVGTRIDNLGVSVGHSHEFSETLSFSGNVGLRHSQGHSRVDGQKVTGTDTGLVYDLSAEKRFERARIRGKYIRTVTPGSRGIERERDILGVNARYGVTSRLGADVGLRASRNSDIGDDSNEVTSLIGRASLTWRFARHWSMRGAYRYRRQDSDNRPDPGESHKFIVSLRYQGDRKILPW